MTVNGILNINKSEGMTSFGVVSRLKRLSGEKHVGHTGTLDPMATGVLPVCFGQATRISSLIMETDKTYIAGIKLGIATDTYDREGKITETNDTSDLTAEQVITALESFTGTIEQVPPAYSAIKHQGKKLYQLARSGILVQPKARKVTINRLNILSIELPLISIEVACSKGTYIRSLAHDLGQKLGCGAHLDKLVRTRCGLFKLDDAIELSAVADAFKQGNWQRLLHPLDYPLISYKKTVLNSDPANDVKHGLSVRLDIAAETPDEIICAYGPDDNFLAMLKYDLSTGLWHPDKVFNTNSIVE
jgi:tRNA pseudouridine55 synthase